MPLKLIPPSDPILWTVAAPITDRLTQVLPYLDEMKALMKQLGGVGLAAPQVGLQPGAWFIMAFRGSIITCVNPRIISEGGANVSRSEGCLSFPGRTTFVPRREIIRAEWTSEEGREFAMQFTHSEARTFSHEYCHTLGENIHARPDPVI